MPHRLRSAAILLAVMPLPAYGDDVLEVTDWYELGTETLVAAGAAEREVEVALPDVVGFEFGFSYSEPVLDDSWASDLQVVAVSPTQVGYTVGGQTNLPLADAEWSFQGKGSDGAGRYGDNGLDVFLPWRDAPRPAGCWTIRVRNDWETDPNPNLYADMRVRFYVCAAPPCPEDIDGDGMVGFADVLRVLANWGPCPGCPEDLDADGLAGFGDVLLILAAWGPCPT